MTTPQIASSFPNCEKNVLSKKIASSSPEKPVDSTMLGTSGAVSEQGLVPKASSV
jgi:hypothetical protein